ncbi:hypothetical protein Scel_88340 [Streptomyces cellostaticus]|nr:hypothetical protein Scel_88340 [Streptomyces cellostaticus]
MRVSTGPWAPESAGATDLHMPVYSSGSPAGLEGGQLWCVNTELDSLATALYVMTDDLLKEIG